MNQITDRYLHMPRTQLDTSDPHDERETRRDAEDREFGADQDYWPQDSCEHGNIAGDCELCDEVID